MFFRQNLERKRHQNALLSLSLFFLYVPNLSRNKIFFKSCLFNKDSMEYLQKNVLELSLYKFYRDLFINILFFSRFIGSYFIKYRSFVPKSRKFCRSNQ